MMYKLLDTVVLDRDLPEHCLRNGDLGAVVQVYEPDGLEVEFVTASGKTQALVTLNITTCGPCKTAISLLSGLSLKPCCIDPRGRSDYILESALGSDYFLTVGRHTLSKRQGDVGRAIPLFLGYFVAN